MYLLGSVQCLFLPTEKQQSTVIQTYNVCTACSEEKKIVYNTLYTENGYVLHTEVTHVHNKNELRIM